MFTPMGKAPVLIKTGTGWGQQHNIAADGYLMRSFDSLLKIPDLLNQSAALPAFMHAAGILPE